MQEYKERNNTEYNRTTEMHNKYRNMEQQNAKDPQNYRIQEYHRKLQNTTETTNYKHQQNTTDANHTDNAT